MAVAFMAHFSNNILLEYDEQVLYTLMFIFIRFCDSASKLSDIDVLVDRFRQMNLWQNKRMQRHSYCVRDTYRPIAYVTVEGN